MEIYTNSNVGRGNNVVLASNGLAGFRALSKALQLAVLGFAGLVIFISGVRVLLAHVQGTLL
jgi:hypothetical protein